MKIVIVTGSRKWIDKSIIWDALDEHNPACIVHGGAIGADSYAHAWAKKRGKIAVVFFPNWGAGKGAALVRNIHMLEKFVDATVLGFPHDDSRGTKHTLVEAKKRNMKTEEYHE